MSAARRPVLSALQSRLFQSAPYEVFWQEFTTAVDEARMQASASNLAIQKERDRIERDHDWLINSMKDWARPALSSTKSGRWSLGKPTST
jgi:hypothetical protein